jgi:hypothetical protein
MKMSKSASASKIRTFDPGHHQATEVTHPVFGYKVSYGRMLEVQARMLAGFVRGGIPRYLHLPAVHMGRRSSSDRPVSFIYSVCEPADQVNCGFDFCHREAVFVFDSLFWVPLEITDR